MHLRALIAALLCAGALSAGEYVYAPGAQSVLENGELALTGVLVGGADAADLVRVSLSAGHGALTLASDTGISFDAGDSTSALSALGTLDAWAAALATITYAPAADWHGEDAIVVALPDAGVNATVPVSVEPADAPPAFAAVPRGLETDEDAPLAYSLAVSAGNQTLWASVGDDLAFEGRLDDLNAALANLTYSPPADWHGFDAVPLAVWDAAGGSAEDQLVVRVRPVDDALVVTAPAAAAVLQGEPTPLEGFSVADADGDDALATVELSEGAYWDPSALAGLHVVDARTVRGTVARINAATVLLQADADTTVTINGDTAVAVSVTPVNAAPTIALPSSPQATAEDTPLLLPALIIADADDEEVEVSLDSTPDATLSLGYVPYWLKFSDAPGDSRMQFSGSVALANEALATLTIAPPAEWHGRLALAVEASDPAAATATALLEVDVGAVDDAAVLVAPAAAETDEDTPVTIAGISLSDVDSDAVALAASAAHGAVALDLLAGELLYTPPADWSGEDTVLLGDEHEIAVTVRAVNDAPRLEAPRQAAGAEDTPLALEGVSFADVDLAAAKLATVSLHADRGALAVAPGADVAVLVDEGSDVLFQGRAADVNVALAGLTYTPPADWHGDDVVTVEVSDRDSDVKTDAVDVRVRIAPVNDAPSLSPAGVVADVDADDVLTVCSATDEDNCVGGGTVDVVNALLAALSDGDWVVADAAGASVAYSAASSAAAEQADRSVAVQQLLELDEDAVAVALPAAVSGVADANSVRVTLATAVGALDVPASADATLDAHGELHGTLDAVNAALADLTYTPPADWHGVDTVTFDGGERTVVVRVRPVDDPLVVTAPATAAVLQGEPTPLEGFSVASADDADTLFTVELSEAYWDPSALAGLHLVDVQTVRGTVARINAATVLVQADADTTVTINGDTAVAVSVTPVNAAPTITVADQAQATAEDTPLELSGIAVADADDTADAVSVSFAASHGSVALTSTSDDCVVVGASVTAAHGAEDADCLALTTATYTPAADWHGRDIVTVTASDAASVATAELAVTVAAVLDPPTLDLDARTVTGDGMLTMRFDGAALPSAALALGVPLRVVDESTLEGPAASLSLALATLDGSLSVVVVDAAGNSVAGALDAEVVESTNDAPTIAGPTTAQRIAEDSALSLAVLQVADADAGTSALTLTLTPDSGAEVVFAADTLTADVEVSANQVRGQVDALNSVLAGASFVPAADFALGATLVVDLEDAQGATASRVLQVHVLPENDAPAIVLEPLLAASEDAPATLTGLLAGVSDPDAGDVLTVSWTLEHGELELETPRGSAAAVAGMAPTYVPPADWSGADTLTVVVTDAVGLSASASTTIDVAAVNDAPVISACGSAPVAVAEDGDTGALGWGVADVDQDADGAFYVTVASRAGVEAELSGTLESVAAELAALSFAPAADFNGEWFNDPATTLPGRLPVAELEFLTVTATDAAGAAASHTCMVSVAWVNDAPTVSAPASLAAPQGAATAVAVSVADVDVAEVWNGTLRVTLSAEGGALDLDSRQVSLDAATGTLEGPPDRVNAALATLTFTSAGLDDGSVHVLVDDQGFSGPPGGPLTAEATIEVHVVAADPDDMVSAASTAFVDEGSRVLLSGLALSAEERDLTGDERLQLRAEATSGMLTLGSGADVAYGDEHYEAATVEVRLTGDWTADALAEVQQLTSRVDYALEVQVIAATNDSTFSFTYGGVTTTAAAPLASGSNDEIRAALETMSNIGSLAVTGGDGEWRVTFLTLAAPVPLLVAEAGTSVYREAEGSLEAAQHRVVINSSGESGTYRLQVDGDVYTTALAHNASAATVRAALELVAGVALAEVTEDGADRLVTFPTTTAGHSLAAMWSGAKGSLACSACESMGVNGSVSVAEEAPGTALLLDGSSTFTLALGDETTGALPMLAPAGAVRAALAALDGVSWCHVSRELLGPEGTAQWTVTFAAADGDVPLLEASSDAIATALVLDGRAGVAGSFSLNGVDLRADASAAQVWAAVPAATAVARAAGEGGQMTWTLSGLGSAADVVADGAALTGSGAAVSVVAPVRALAPGDMQVLSVSTNSANASAAVAEVQTLTFWPTTVVELTATGGAFQVNGSSATLYANSTADEVAAAIEGAESVIEVVAGVWNVTGDVASSLQVAGAASTAVLVYEGPVQGLVTVQGELREVPDPVEGLEWTFTFGEFEGDVDAVEVEASLLTGGSFKVEETVRGVAPISGLLQLPNGAVAHDASAAEVEAALPAGATVLDRWAVLDAEYGYAWSIAGLSELVEASGTDDGDVSVVPAAAVAVREGTLDALSASLAALQFHPEPQWNSLDHGRALVAVSLALEDGTVVGETELAVHVAAVNDAPQVLVADGGDAVEWTEDAVFTLGDWLSVADADEDARVSVAVSATHGTPSLTAYSGSVANVNAALAALTVTPDADWHSDVVPMVQTITSVVDSSVQAQTVRFGNETFSLTFEDLCTSGAIAYGDDAAAVAAALAGCPFDVAVDRRLGGDTWTIEFSGGSTSMPLGAANVSSVTVEYDWFVPEVMSLGLPWDATAAEVAAALGDDVEVSRSPAGPGFTWSITYADDLVAADAVLVQARAYEPLVVTVEATDDGGSSASGELSLVVAAVDDAPVISLPATVLVVEEDVGAFIEGVSVTDVDDEVVPSEVSVTCEHCELSWDGAVISYQTEADFAGRDVLTVSLRGASASMAVVSTPVDDAPTWSAPAAVFTTEDLPVGISGISVADPDVDDVLTVSPLAASEGSLEFASPEIHRVLLDGDTMVGTLANVNEALATLTYVPPADWTGTAVVSVGADVAIEVTVSAADDGLALEVPAAPLRTREDEALVVTGISVVDPDAEWVSVSVLGEELQGSVAEVNALLAAGVVYSPPADWSGLDRVAVVASDGALAAASASFLVVVEAVNDPPSVVRSATTVVDPVTLNGVLQVEDDSEEATVELTTGAVSWSSGLAHPLPSGAGFFGSVERVNLALNTLVWTGDESGELEITVTDSEMASVTTSVSVVLSSSVDVVDAAGAELHSPESVDVDEDGSVLVDSFTLSYSDAAEWVEVDVLGETMAGEAADVAAALAAGVVYSPPADFFGELVLGDDDVVVTVAPVNDAPTIVSGGELGSLVLSDVDDDVLELALEAAHGGVALVELQAAGVSQFSATRFGGSVAALNAALGGGGLVYVAPSGWEGADALTATATDGAGLSASATLSVDVALAAEPTLEAPAGPLAVDEDAALEVEFAAPYWHPDTGPVWVEFASAEAGVLAAFELAAPAETLAVTYVPAAHFNGRDVLTLTVDHQWTASVDVDVAAVNDAPEASAAATQVATDEDVAAALPAIVVVDIDAQESPASLMLVTMGAEHGVLDVTSTRGLRLLDDGFEGSLSSVNYALESLTYTPEADWSGDDVVTVTVSDEGNTGAGGALSSTVELAVSVAAVEDPAWAAFGVSLVQASEDQMVVVPFTSSLADGELLAEADNCLVAVGRDGVELIGEQDWNGRTTLVLSSLLSVGGEALAEVDVVVSAVNDAPVVVAAASVAETDEDVAVALPAVSVEDSGLLRATLSTSTGGSVWTGGSLAGLSVSGGELYGPAEYLAAALGELWFEGAVDDVVTVTVTDDEGLSSAATVAVSVAAVNDAPTVTVASLELVEEDTVYELSGATVADPDLGSGFVDVLVQTDTGAVFTDGMAEAAELAFSGTLDEVNAVLASLKYRPLAHGGLDFVAIVASDGLASTTLVVDVSVSATEDATLVSLPAATASTAEDEPVVVGPAVVSDSDGSADVSVAVSATQRVVHEVQTVTVFAEEHVDRVQQITAEEGGVFQLALDGYGTTGDIAADAVASEEEETAASGKGASVEAQLRALGTGLDVEVWSPSAGVWDVTFVDAPASLPELTTNNASVTVTVPASTVDESPFLLTLSGVEAASELAVDASALEMQTALAGAVHEVLVTRSAEPDLDGGYTWSVTFLAGPPSAVLAAEGSAHVSTARAVEGFGLPELQRVSLRASHRDLVQRINVTAPEAGWFRLSLDGAETADIRYDAPATLADEEYWTKGESIEAVLEAVHAGGVTVFRQPTVFYAWIVTFHALSFDSAGLAVESEPLHGSALVETLVEANSLSGEAVLEGLPADAVVAYSALDLEGGYDITVSAGSFGGETVWVDTSAFAGDGHSSRTTVLQSFAGSLSAELLEGSVSAVNDALQELVYSPAADWWGYVDIDVGGSALELTVEPVDDASQVSFAVDPLLAVEDAELVWLGASVSDVDVGTSWVTVHARVSRGTLFPGSDNGVDDEECTNGLWGTAAVNVPCTSPSSCGDEGWCETASGDWGGCGACSGGDAEVVLTGTLATVNAGLEDLRYRGDGHWSGVDTLVVFVEEDGVYGEVEIEVSAVDDATVVVLDGFPLVDFDTDAPPRGVLTVDEDSVTSLGGGMVSVVDVDSALVSVSLSALYGSLSQTLVEGALSAVDFDSLTYTPPANWFGVDTLTIEAGGHARQIVVNVTSVPDGPEVSLVPLQHVDEDSALLVHDLWVDDVDLFVAAGGAERLAHSNSWVLPAQTFQASTGYDSGEGDVSELMVDVRVTHGVVTLADAVNVTFVRGDGERDERVTFNGTLESVNRALYGLSFVPDADVNSDEFGLAELDVTVSDGALWDFGRVLVSVDAVNDAPQLLPVGHHLHAVSGLVHDVDTHYVNEDTWLALPVAVVDVDSTYGLLSVSVYATNGTVELPPVHWVSDFSFEATLDNLNVALAGLEFQSSSVGAASVTISVDDGAGGVDSTVIPIVVEAVNAGPVLAGAAEYVALEEDSSALVSFALTSDEAEWQVFDAEVWAAHGVTSLGDGFAGLSFADAARELGEFTYTPDADWFGDDEVVVVVRDGHGSVASASMVMEVAGVDDAPELWAPAGVSTLEDRPVTIAGLRVFDLEDDYLSLTTSTGVSLAGVPATLNEALQTVVYEPAADFWGNDSVVVACGGVEVEVPVEVLSVADAPVWTVPRATQPVDEGFGAHLSGISVWDVDDEGAGEFSLTVTAEAGWVTLTETSLTFDEGDGHTDARLVARGSLELLNQGLDRMHFLPDGTNLGRSSVVLTLVDPTGLAAVATVWVRVASFVDDDTVLTVPGQTWVEEPCESELPLHRVCGRVVDVDTVYGSEDELLVVSGVAVEDVDSPLLSYTATCEAGCAWVEWDGGPDVEYMPAADWSGDDVIRLTAGTASAWIPVHVWAVPDPPVLFGGEGIEFAVEDTDTDLSGFSVACNDEGAVLSVTVSGDGWLRSAGAAVGLDDFGWLSPFELEGSVERLNEALAGLEYLPPTDECGMMSLSWVVAWADQTAERTVYVYVACVNDAPVASVDSTVVVVADEEATLEVGPFSFEDVDAGPVTYVSGAVSDVLYESSGSVWATVTGEADFVGDLDVTVTFTDDGGLSASATRTVRFEAVNDAPVVELSDEIVYLDEGDTVRVERAVAGVSGSVVLDGGAGYDLFRSRGSRPSYEATAAEWKHYRVAAGNVSNPRHFAALDADTVMFAANEPGELWRSDDGVATSLVMAEDLRPSWLAALGGEVWFQGSGAFTQWSTGELLERQGFWLMVSASTTWDSALVYDCPVGYHVLTTAEYSGLTFDGGDGVLYDAQERGMFRFLDSHETGYFLDAGQPEGARAELDTGDTSGVFSGMVCGAGDPEERENGLWRSDGTWAGTWRESVVASAPEGLTAFGDALYFSAETVEEGRELWSWSAAGGVELVADTVRGAASGNPSALVVSGGSELFFAADGKLWTREGHVTAELTGVGSLAAAAGGGVYFNAEGSQVWLYNASALTLVADGLDDPQELTAFDGRVWFVAGGRVYADDVEVDFYGGLEHVAFVVWDGRLFFRARNRLWRVEADGESAVEDALQDTADIWFDVDVPFGATDVALWYAAGGGGTRQGELTWTALDRGRSAVVSSVEPDEAITVSWACESGALSFASPMTGSVDELNLALRYVTYTSGGIGWDSCELRAEDDGGMADSRVMRVFVQDVNQSPWVATDGREVGDDGGYVQVSLSGAVVELGARPSANVVVSGSGASVVLTGGVADVNEVLASLSCPASLVVHVSDLGRTGKGGEKTATGVLEC